MGQGLVAAELAVVVGAGYSGAVGPYLDPISDVSPSRAIDGHDHDHNGDDEHTSYSIAGSPADSVDRVPEDTERPDLCDRRAAAAGSPAVRERARQKGACYLDPSRVCKPHSLQEFSTLTEKNTVYKLIGPVLVQQDQTEAKANVEKRLEFITSEMCVPRHSVCLLVARHLCSDQIVSASKDRSKSLRRKRRTRNQRCGVYMIYPCPPHLQSLYSSSRSRQHSNNK